MTDASSGGGAAPASGCPRCVQPIGAADRFCEACGASLQVRRASSTGSARGDEQLCRECGHRAEPADGGYCPRCGVRHRDAADRIELDLGTLAGVTDRGHVHARNEDAMALGRHVAGVRAAVVCDGVSTTRAPELASRAASEAALDVLLAGVADPVERTRDAVAAAARAVDALDGHHDDGPSCTLVSVVVDPGGPEITVGWVGDSRAYWLAAAAAREPSRALTSDHSWAAEAVADGLLDAATAAADRRAHAITRWLGPGGGPDADVVTLRPTGSGVLLVCSDGLWNYLPEAADLAAAALPAVTTPLAAAAALTTIALDAGGHDNVTAVIIPVIIPVGIPVGIPVTVSPSP